ncbi:protein CEBPZOS-like [Littorina saxatilis]|uniref:Uncharacterized protein n=1 Tax=Littorina saxatilis TaxID=31220 RepID=A0AAN9GE62_9CAEN
MKKEPKRTNFRSLLGTGIKAVLVLEGLGLVATYGLWNRMNNSQDFRLKVYTYCPPVLESYYLIGEMLGSLPTKKHDYDKWGVARDK